MDKLRSVKFTITGLSDAGMWIPETDEEGNTYTTFNSNRYYDQQIVIDSEINGPLVEIQWEATIRRALQHIDALRERVAHS